MPLPDFLILGSMKCGTGSLYYDLCEHPQARAANKETHFLDSRENFERKGGLSKYKKEFPETGGNEVTGEATPQYLRSSEAAALVQKHFPEPPLMIVLMRNPVDRAISNYHHCKRIDSSNKYDDTESFEEGYELAEVVGGSTGVLSKGLYLSMLEVYLDIFDRDRFYIVASEDYWSHPSGAYSEICDKLGIDPDYDADYRHYKGGQDYSYDDIERQARVAIRDKHYLDEVKELPELIGSLDYGPHDNHWYVRWQDL